MIAGGKHANYMRISIRERAERKKYHKQNYDRKSSERTFEEGEFLLVFPCKKNKLLNEWQGPFFIS